MKNFSIVLIACFAVFQLACADSNYAKDCLLEHGMKETDMTLLSYVGRVSFLEVVKDEQKDKLSCVLACIFHKENPAQSLYEVIKDIVSEDKGGDLRKEMLGNLTTCKTQAGDDDCKLLQCVRITELPFYDPLYTYAVTRDMIKCFVDNGLKASDAVNMDHLTDPGELENILKKLDEDKLACAITCLYTKQVDLGTSLQKRFETKINENEKFTADQKKEILETLNKCGTEAAGDNCKLVKCIKILRPPFLNVYHQ